MIEKKLSNGLKIYFDINRDYKYSCIMMFFGVGWRDDDTKKMGIAHLFEHLVGKRTHKHKNKGEIHSVKNSYGIKFNAVTTPNSTSYHHSQLHEVTPMSLNLLLESIYDSYFDLQDLASEKDVVKRESENYFDNKYNFLWDSITKKLFPNTNLSNCMFGTEETLDSITLKDFDNFYKGYLNPKNANLLLGIKDERQMEELINIIEEFYKKCDKLTTIEFVKNKIEIQKKSIMSKDINISKDGKTQADVAIVFEHDKLSSGQLVALDILVNILVGNWSSLIFNRLRDELALVYGMWIHSFKSPDLSYSYIYFSVSKDKANQAISEVKSIIGQAKNNIDQKMLVASKNKFILDTVSDYNLVKILYGYRDSIINGNNIITFEDKINLAEKIELKDILDLIDFIFNKKECHIVTVQ